MAPDFEVTKTLLEADKRGSVAVRISTTKKWNKAEIHLGQLSVGSLSERRF